ncbi:MAG TPA: hypothetical protein VLW50_22075 [Streptosporangiaceae bacterium]|nr:hypothetical protein [Streptosporangiaceae bacterium]
MGTKSTKDDDTGQQKYPPRKAPVTAEELTSSARHEPSNDAAEAVDLSKREGSSYRKCVDAYARALKKEPISATEKDRQCALFSTGGWYATEHKQVTPKGDDTRPYWEVTTTSTFEKGCIYKNRFYPDGEIMAVSNYHPNPDKIQAVEKDDHTYSIKVLTMANSTVFWCQRQYLLNQKIELAAVTDIVRHEVSNDHTNDAARACFLISVDTKKMKKFPEHWYYRWDVAGNNECINALLGTPNGLGAFFLVRDWGKELGITGIEFIEIEKPGPGTNRQVDVTISFERG